MCAFLIAHKAGVLLPATFSLLLGAGAPCQDRVKAEPNRDLLPVLRQDNRPVADADLIPVLTAFNGQHTLDQIRSPGLTTVSVPNQLGSVLRGGSPVVAIGTVLRSEAVLTPDRTGVATVLTVMPSAILLGKPVAVAPGQPQITSRPRGIRETVANTTPRSTSAMPLVLRYVLAGGTVYFDDNNGVSVRQAGLTYPMPGTELALGGVQVGASAALLLQAACELRGSACESIDGNPLTSDAITAGLPGGIATARAFSLEGAPIADSGSTGVRGLGRFLESRYRINAGDLRAVHEVAIPVLESFLPAVEDEVLVRAEAIQVASSLLSDATGIVGASLVAIKTVIHGSSDVPLRGRTIEIVQRGGCCERPMARCCACCRTRSGPLRKTATTF